MGEELIVHLLDLENIDCLSFGFYHCRVEAWRLFGAAERRLALIPRPPPLGESLASAFTHENVYVTAAFLIDGPQHSPRLNECVSFALASAHPRNALAVRVSIWVCDDNDLPQRHSDALGRFTAVTASEITITGAARQFGQGVELLAAPNRLLVFRSHLLCLTTRRLNRFSVGKPCNFD